RDQKQQSLFEIVGRGVISPTKNLDTIRPGCQMDELRNRVRDKCDRLHALLALQRLIKTRELDILERTRGLLTAGSRELLERAEFTLDVNLQQAEAFAGYK